MENGRELFTECYTHLRIPTNELVYKLTELKATYAAKEGKNNHHLGISTFTHLDLTPTKLNTKTNRAFQIFHRVP